MENARWQPRWGTMVAAIASVPFWTACSVEERTPATAPRREAAELSRSAPLREERFRWRTPPHWRELEPRGMRIADLRTESGVECSLVELFGSAGSPAANIDRWRGEMGHPPASADELATSPKRELLGVEAIGVELDGVFRALQGRTIEEARLIGWIAVGERSSVLAMMVGPREHVAQERAHFDDFLDSLLRVPEQPSWQTLYSADGLRWERPPTWSLAEARPMRLATFQPDGDPRIECVLTFMPGAAGGLAANVNRWRQQMGLTAASSEELAALTRLDILGAEAPLIELDGTYRGMSGEVVDEAGFLGLVASSGDRTLFVRLVGPRGLVAAQRQTFLAFARSLRFEDSATPLRGNS